MRYWFPLVSPIHSGIKRKETLRSEFKEGILILAALLGAGYSMENALEAGEAELRAL